MLTTKIVINKNSNNSNSKIINKPITIDSSNKNKSVYNQSNNRKISIKSMTIKITIQEFNLHNYYKKLSNKPTKSSINSHNLIKPTPLSKNSNITTHKMSWNFHNKIKSTNNIYKQFFSIIVKSISVFPKITHSNLCKNM